MVNASLAKFIPASVRGMKQINREKFSNNIKVAVLKLSKDKVTKAMTICKSFLFKINKFKPVQTLNDEDQRFNKCIYLHPGQVMCWEDLPETHRQSLSENGINEDNLVLKDFQLTYENFKHDEIFKAVLPEDTETVSGFSQIGHIIHLNLREKMYEYKSLIGNVLLDNIKTCRTVINKSQTINNTYRNFSSEVIAGDEDFLVTVKEHQCFFKFDFSKVYWNPRLSIEHERILNCLKPGDILFDVFCGVGPFAIPAVKKKCRVFANDLNPEAYRWLNYNANHNKIIKALFKSYNLDGQEFICIHFKEFIEKYCKGKIKINPGAKIHVTMNLPAIAVQFLKHFNGLIDDEDLSDNFKHDVIVYIYCFTPAESTTDTLKQMINDNIGRDVSSEILNISFVRNVSPQKHMYKVQLRLTKEVLFNVDSDICEPPLKKFCVETKK